MAPCQFPCPRCSAPLRARDQSVAGQIIRCPDCDAELLIEAEGDGSLIARPHSDVSPFAADPQPAPPPGKLAIPERSSALRWNSPLVWGAAALGTVLLAAVAMWLGRSPTSALPTDRAPTGDERIADTDDTVDPAAPELVADDPAAARLTALAKPLAAFREQSGGPFPAQSVASGLAPQESLSWIAQFSAQTDADTLPPLWDRPWNDPLNEHFVRRAQPAFLNPALDQTASADRYPATHFVGIAGVGPDAAELPKTDRRAGIFGNTRIVTADDVGDGLANTWLISGVQRDIGAWAAGGRATIRGLTAEPYIGGPDGLGIGRTDRMPVLMADGSVRSVSVATAPQIVRRMAAMNDGFPLDPAVAGEPGDKAPERPAAEPPPAVVVAGPAADDPPPVEAPLPADAVLRGILAQLERELPAQPVPEPEPVDVERQLAQKLEVFEQTKSVPLREMLLEFEEIAGVPIDLDDPALGPAAARLDQDVKVALLKPTLKDVLERLLDQAELSYRIDAGRIVIVAPTK